MAGHHGARDELRGPGEGTRGVAGEAETAPARGVAGTGSARLSRF